MPDIYSTAATDGYIEAANRSYSVAREATSGTSMGLAVASDAEAVQATKNTLTRTFTVSRVFLTFNVSSIYNIPEAATLTIKGLTNGGADMYCVMGTQPAVSVTLGDFDSIYGWDHDADNSSNVRYYSSEITTWNVGIPGTNTITLNDNALGDIAGHPYLNICMLTGLYDLRNVAPTNLTAKSGMYFSNALGTSSDPKLSYTAGADTSAALMQPNF